MKAHSDHEKLDVYQEAIGFIKWVDEMLAAIPKALYVLLRCSRGSFAAPLHVVSMKLPLTAAGCRERIRITSRITIMIGRRVSRFGGQERTPGCIIFMPGS
jgi:hypothetical protein